jgi:nucleotide-binding universal stress UspA family protein
MYQKIMVPLDGSKLAECVLPHIEAIVKAGGVPNIALVRVVEPFSLTPVRGEPAFTEEQIKRIDSEGKIVAEKYLDELVNQLSNGGVNVQTDVLTGKVAESLADYATNNDVNLIIIATHGRSGISRWVWGSVADRILRSSCVPILMVRAPGCVPGI